MPLTYFEFATLAALILFEVKEVDVAIMEAGMGGRLDAVNLVAGIATLITNVSLDHAEWLGNTRNRIAREKAGLIHKGVPVVIGDADPPTVLEEKAAEFGAPCYLAGRDFGYRIDRDKAKWAWWGGYPDASAAHEDLPPPLGGWDEQFMNAACVLQVLACIRESVAVTTECCRDGLRRASISCRSQILRTRPHVLLDVAHNPASVAVLRRNLESLSIGGHVYGIFSMIEGKDVAECVGAIAGLVGTTRPHRAGRPRLRRGPGACKRCAPRARGGVRGPPDPLRDRVSGSRRGRCALPADDGAESEEGKDEGEKE